MPIFEPVPQPNIGNLILQGLGGFQAGLGLQRQMEQSERQRMMDDLAQRAADDPRAFQKLALMDPNRALAFQRIGQQESALMGARQKQEMATQARFERERAHTANLIKNLPLDRQVEVLDWRIDMVRKRGGDPSDTQELRNMLASGDPRIIAQGQQTIQAADRLGVLQGHTPSETPESRTALAKDLDLLNDPKLTQEQRSIVLSRLLPEQTVIETTPEGALSVRMGRGVRGAAPDLEKPVKRELQKSVVAGERQLGALDRLEGQFDKDFLTYLGRGRAFMSGIKSKAGIGLSEDERGFMKNRRKFTQNVNRFFNQYRKEITGAAASMMELNSLKKAIFNEDLSPDEFKAAFDEFKSEVQRTQRLNRRLLREGVSGNLKNKRSPAAQQLDAMFLRGEDDDPAQRIQDLLNEGKDKEEIFEILQTEGYR